jgi:hypothetical protein
VKGLRYLLHPTEERELIRHLTEEVGLVLLSPQATDPMALISDDFPWHTYLEPRDVHDAEIVFWASSIGPVRRLGDAPVPNDAAESVALKLNQDASSEWRTLVDLARTPVISWRRPAWYRKDRRCLVPGRLGSMSTRIGVYPPALRTLFASLERWLKKRGTVVNAFDHLDLSLLSVPPPQNRRLFAVAVWPQGMAWLANGGQLWPWDS